MDLIIRNGTVIDGTGAPARLADVAVAGDRIAAVEPGCSGEARRVIDAAGLILAPGFIDVKTHSDFTLPLYPQAESRVHQGITTELVGSCGFTAAPIPPAACRSSPTTLPPWGRAWLAPRRASRTTSMRSPEPRSMSRRRSATTHCASP